jgi:hypothetical protein
MEQGMLRNGRHLMGDEAEVAEEVETFEQI